MATTSSQSQTININDFILNPFTNKPKKKNKTETKLYSIFKRDAKKHYKCSTCGKLFSGLANVIVHARNHSGDRPYQCKICQKSFSHLTSCKLHVRTHFPNKRFKCEICEVEFALKSSLTNHKVQVHQTIKTTDDKLISSVVDCVFCGKRLPSMCLYHGHLSQHTKERPYFCNICPAELKTKAILNVHLLTHEIERQRSFKCDFCNKTFFEKYALVRHIRIHINEKPFKCDFCSKTFLLKFQLTNHQRNFHSDEDEKPYACKFCEKTFSIYGSLWAHVKSHSKDKPHKCRFCKKSYKGASELKRHAQCH